MLTATCVLTAWPVINVTKVIIYKIMGHAKIVVVTVPNAQVVWAAINVIRATSSRMEHANNVIKTALILAKIILDAVFAIRGTLFQKDIVRNVTHSAFYVLTIFHVSPATLVIFLWIIHANHVIVLIVTL